MKCIVALVLVAAISSASGDDGKYHPGKYGNEGLYKPTTDGRYYDYQNRYNNYYGRNIYNPAYSPFYYNSLQPYQELVAPFVRSDVPQVVVTARPPIVTSTAVPVIPAVKYVPLYANNHYLNGRSARIITQDSDSSANGYHYSFQTENGIAAEETGNVATANEGNKVRGFYEYVGDDGLTYRVDYTADENGFHPTGAHLP
ncbi:larval cuticle protein LCP-30-like [Pieris rapae]|uniref:larval cuticle protein LCP-30-like n=1 Tax=Pieris rapae TaxID=64459 RepID=UPI001E280B70|nr:larval cuticle protein LCP-30-like [Pieris rapae]